VSSRLLTGIGELLTNDAALPGATGAAGVLAAAAVVIDEDRIAWVGPAVAAPAADTAVDLQGRAVIPGFVDSHSHLVFAGDRLAEFTARMAGQRYAAGGIRTTVAATRAAADEDLRATAARLTAEMVRQGTTTVEIKSGYGLTTDDEARSLRIAAEFTSETTYLGAHVVPDGVARDDYLSLVVGQMLAACAPHARWVDAFCDAHAFDVAECRAVLTAGIAAGLQPRLHANQSGHGGGVRLACELGAAAVDHCTFLDDADVTALADSGTVATLLPGVEFATRMPYPDARRLLDAGVTVALACDCNPGSCYSTSMPLMIALAVREMAMTPTEAVTAATAGGAAALRRDDIGRVTPGALADLVVLDAPSHAHLAYRAGVPLVSEVYRHGVALDRVASVA
jgi:imidazolonepropionase